MTGSSLAAPYAAQEPRALLPSARGHFNPARAEAGKAHMADDGLIYVDGKGYGADDLTFREQRELRRLYRELNGDPNADLGDAAGMDFFPLLAYMVRKRDDPEYTLDQALDLTAGDLLTPPTRPAAKPKAKVSG